jgi:hypothetical protein
VPQLSVAVAVPGAGTLEGLQPRSEPEGQWVKVGGSLSTTWISLGKLQVTVPLSQVSVRVKEIEPQVAPELTETDALLDAPTMDAVPEVEVTLHEYVGLLQAVAAAPAE